MTDSTTYRSALDGALHRLPSGPTWTHNLADGGRHCPCRPDIRTGIVIHHKNRILEAAGREVIRAAVAKLAKAVA